MDLSAAEVINPLIGVEGLWAHSSTIEKKITTENLFNVS